MALGGNWAARLPDKYQNPAKELPGLAQGEDLFLALPPLNGDTSQMLY